MRIFDHPHAKWLADHEAVVSHASLGGEALDVGVLGRGDDPIDHGVEEMHLNGDPRPDRWVHPFGQTQHGATKCGTVVRHVITAHDRRRRDALRKAERQRFEDETGHGPGSAWRGDVMLDIGVVKVKFACGRDMAIALFGHRHGDEPDRWISGSIEGSMQRQAVRIVGLIEHGNMGELGADQTARHGPVCTQFTAKQPRLSPEHIRQIRRPQVDADNAPIAELQRQRVIGPLSLMAAMEGAVAKVEDAGFQGRAIISRPLHRVGQLRRCEGRETFGGVSIHAGQPQFQTKKSGITFPPADVKWCPSRGSRGLKHPAGGRFRRKAGKPKKPSALD
jgi:hypothetical protein